MGPRRIRSFAFATAAVLAALLASPGPATAQERIRVKVAQAGRFLSFAPMDVAVGKKLFDAEGLDAEVQIVAGVVGSQGLAGGGIDIDVDASNNVLRLVDRGLPLLTVQTMVASLTMNMAVRREAIQAKGVTRQSPLEARFAALKGLTIGITTPGAASDTYTRWMLKQAGIDPLRDVRIVQIGGGDALLAAMRARQIDAFLSSPPGPDQAEFEGFGTVFIANTAGEVPGFRNFLHQIVAIKRDFGERNPEAVRRFTRGLGRAINLMIDQPEESKRVLQTFWPKIHPEVLSHGVDAMRATLPRDGWMTEEHWKGTLRVFQDLGIVTRSLETREGPVWTNRYITRTTR
ncbi:MAG: ABC transporter substrate-binding protein [Deltaproteobacteria bacterium]|nr:ABC transporter substrate-binding protein [Deltaproteobacteria bacterium]MBI3077088.1 ABC transporter substrate-binding protein [Deltaproteobacteria bacterium]